MATKKDVEAGKAYVTLYARMDPLLRALSSVDGTMDAWGKRTMMIGTAITATGLAIEGALGAAIAVFASTGSHLDDLSKRTGVAVKSLAELQYAAEQSGTGLEAVIKALINLEKKGLSPDDFGRYASEIARIEDPTKRAQKAIEMFGKTGIELLPMLDELTSLRLDAQRLGLVPTEQSIRDAARLGDAFDKLGSVIRGAMYNIGAAIGPVITPLVEALGDIIGGFNVWAKENKELLGTITLAVAAIGAITLAIGGLTVAIGTAIVAAGALAASLTVLAPFAATVLTPMTLIIAGAAAVVVSLGAAFLALDYAMSGVTGTWGFWNTISTELGNLGILAREIGKDIGEIFEPVKRALGSGEIELAAKIVAKTMQVYFMEAVAAIVRSINEIPASLKAVKGLLPTAVGGAIGAAEVAAGIAAGPLDRSLQDLRAELETLKAKGNALPGQPQEGTPEWYAQQLMAGNTLGSMSAQQLRMQSWGQGVAAKKKDPAEVLQKFLEETFKRLGMEMRDIKQAVKDNNYVYGLT